MSPTVQQCWAAGAGGATMCSGTFVPPAVIGTGSFPVGTAYAFNGGTTGATAVTRFTFQDSARVSLSLVWSGQTADGVVSVRFFSFALRWHPGHAQSARPAPGFGHQRQR